MNNQHTANSTERVRGLGDFLVEVHTWLSAELDTLLRQVDELMAGDTDDTTTSNDPTTSNDATTSDDRANPLNPATRVAKSLHQQLHERCLSFCGALERHHQGEDYGAFPMLAQSFPELAPTLERLAAEHVVVAEINQAIHDLLDGYVPGPSQLGELRAELQRLVDRLREHFAVEESTIVEALNAVAEAPALPDQN